MSVTSLPARMSFFAQLIGSVTRPKLLLFLPLKEKNKLMQRSSSNETVPVAAGQLRLFTLVAKNAYDAECKQHDIIIVIVCRDPAFRTGQPELIEYLTDWLSEDTLLLEGGS